MYTTSELMLARAWAGLHASRRSVCSRPRPSRQNSTRAIGLPARYHSAGDQATITRPLSHIARPVLLVAMTLSMMAPPFAALTPVLA